MIVSTTFMIIVGWYRPFDTATANRLEIFTECITLGVLYTLMLYTDFVPEAADRYTCGPIFIALIMVYLAVHLSVIAFVAGLNARQSCRRCMIRRKHKAQMEKSALTNNIEAKYKLDNRYSFHQTGA